MTDSRTVSDMPVLEHLRLLAKSVFARRFHQVRIFRLTTRGRQFVGQLLVKIDGEEYVRAQTTANQLIMLENERIETLVDDDSPEVALSAFPAAGSTGGGLSVCRSLLC